MTRKHKQPSKKSNNKNIFIIGGIVVVVSLIIFLKGQWNQGDPIPAAQAPESAVVENEAPEKDSELLIAQDAQELPEQKLDRLYVEKEPVFAFFHSDNCYLCIEMMKVVDEVFPEYVGKVNLIDINVYDAINKNLLQRAQIQAIPTQIFINSSGEISREVGLMSADQLRSVLDQISGE